MHKLKKIALATGTASIIAMSPLAVTADDGDLSRQLSEAHQEGSVSTAFALNRHLSPFSIDVDVAGGTAVLTGEVESDVDRDLAEQVALGVDGVDSVDNQLVVNADVERNTEDRELSSSFANATISATVKSKLLWNRNTEGLDIKVSTDDGVVTLSGVAGSAEARELAERLAENTDDVRSVKNNITVSAEETTASRAQAAIDEAGDAVSDAWITSKVKSSFLLDSELDGMDISVETKDGKVKLSGAVESSAEKALAEEVAQNIRGVKDVDAEALRVAS